jgi:hypothetical protein
MNQMVSGLWLKNKRRFWIWKSRFPMFGFDIYDLPEGQWMGNGSSNCPIWKCFAEIKG